MGLSSDPTDTAPSFPAPTVVVTVAEVTEASADVVESVGRLAQALPRFKDVPTADHIQRVIDSPATRLLVARDEGGEVVGMLTVAVYPMPTGVRVWFEDTSVSQRGKGVGRLLTEAALKIAREAGAADAEFIVQPSQTGALKMASLMGFGPNDEDTRRIWLR